MADKANVSYDVTIERGMYLELLNESNEVLFRARVKDFDGESLSIVSDTGGSMPPVVYGRECKLRAYLAGDKTVFYHAVVQGSTATMWKLGELSNWFTWERREYFRQDVTVEALVKRIRLADDTAVREGAVACELLDVSGGGVSLLCQSAYEVGDVLSVGNAEIMPDAAPFSFHCVVRRVEAARHGAIYGCQFHEIRSGEQDRLIRAIFYLQREQAKRLRGR